MYMDANLISRNKWIEQLSPLKKRIKMKEKNDIRI